LNKERLTRPKKKGGRAERDAAETKKHNLKHNSNMDKGPFRGGPKVIKITGNAAGDWGCKKNDRKPLHTFQGGRKVPMVDWGGGGKEKRNDLRLKNSQDRVQDVPACA